jgi:excisionase family DNA binding protein
MTTIEEGRSLSDYLTVGEAAAKLGVSRSTLRNWDRAGKLTPHRHPINGYRLYQQSELENLLAQIVNGKETT